MRRLYGGYGAIQFAEDDHNLYGNFMKLAGMSAFGMPKYELGHGIFGATHTGIHMPYMEYTLEGDAESGYSLNSSVSFFDFETFTDYFIYNSSDGYGAFSLGWDSSFGSPTANEIRPVNTAVRYFIRAR